MFRIFNEKTLLIVVNIISNGPGKVSSDNIGRGGLKLGLEKNFGEVGVSRELELKTRVFLMLKFESGLN